MHFNVGQPRTSDCMFYTVVIKRFETFDDSQNTIRRKTKLPSLSNIPACDW